MKSRSRRKELSRETRQGGATTWLDGDKGCSHQRVVDEHVNVLAWLGSVQSSSWWMDAEMMLMRGGERAFCSKIRAFCSKKERAFFSKIRIIQS